MELTICSKSNTVCILRARQQRLIVTKSLNGKLAVESTTQRKPFPLLAFVTSFVRTIHSILPFLFTLGLVAPTRVGAPTTSGLELRVWSFYS